MKNLELITWIIAAISGITGLLLLLAPQTLIKAGEFFNRLYNLESVVYTERRWFGLVFIAAGSILLYILW